MILGNTINSSDFQIGKEGAIRDGIERENAWPGQDPLDTFGRCRCRAVDREEEIRSDGHIQTGEFGRRGHHPRDSMIDRDSSLLCHVGRSRFLGIRFSSNNKKP